MLGFAPPHAEFVVPGTILLVLGIVFITAARFWPESSAPVVTDVSAAEVTALSEPLDLTGPVTAFTRAITWPLAIDENAGALTDAERRHLIDGFAIVGDAWSAALLAQAFDEEDDDLRVQVVEAIARCAGPAVVPLLERAYASYAVAERYAAIDGASRRGEVPLLERGLRDTDGTVALAAAYGLAAAGRREIVDGAIRDRNDVRADEIRRVLAMLDDRG